MKWSGAWDELQRRDRVPLIREVRCETSDAVQTEQGWERPHEPASSRALTINVGNGGLCLLTDWRPAPREIVRLHMPMPIASVKTPTLAEVCWQRALPFKRDGIYVVGLRFLL
jgi:hypothetical protein